MFPLHCCSKVSLGSSSIWGLGSHCLTVGGFSRQGGRGKKKKLVNDSLFLLKLGQELSTQGPCVCVPFCWEVACPPWQQPLQHMHLEGLWFFQSSNFSEILLILHRWTAPVGKVALLSHRRGSLASYNLRKVESVNVTAHRLQTAEQLAFRTMGESGSGDRMSSGREDGSWCSLCSQAVWELILGHELLAHQRPPAAGVGSCQCMSLSQRAGAPQSWEVTTLGQSCSPSSLLCVRILSTSCHWHCSSLKQELRLISGAACSAAALAVAAFWGSYELLTR